ncbi:MAG: DUF89 family protein [candidate division Zixibacteria bacterium]|nr:DUF89 family protein [candidate division Zixibacteria bacterium]
MNTYLACFPCFVRQAYDAARFATDDKTIHERVLRDVLHTAATMDMHLTPPEMGQFIHKRIRELTGNADPYHEVKKRFNRLALDFYPNLQRRIHSHADPLAMAVRLAIAGNIIDFGPRCDIPVETVRDSIDSALTASIDMNALVSLRSEINSAKTILFLGDNAGEIVFDKLLLEILPCEKISYVVKGAPIINDATMDDAVEVGLTDLVEVIDNGADVPGTILPQCSEAFRARFETADLVIAKGQGNYESLSDVDINIVFLLKAKCPVIAEHLHCPVGSMVIAGTRNNP